MVAMTNSEVTASTDNPHPDLGRAVTVLGTVSALLDTVDWDGIKEMLDKAESLGPFLDPTVFMRSLDSGVLARNQAVVVATIAYLDVLRKVDAEVRANGSTTQETAR